MLCINPASEVSREKQYCIERVSLAVFQISTLHVPCQSHSLADFGTYSKAEIPCDARHRGPSAGQPYKLDGEGPATSRFIGHWRASQNVENGGVRGFSESGSKREAFAQRTLD